MSLTNKHKIINDPVYGFIYLSSELIFDLIEHPWYQRLRRISQLGLTYLVYPGAYHTRFHHALGAMHLMGQAISVLRTKGHEVTEEEAEAAAIAILLHDIGHGPFSHALEHSIAASLSHEYLSLKLMQQLNIQFDGKLDLAIKIFTNTYEKRFLHQLISSQLDVDRLDYLRRDSFYTGVTEGAVNSERLITMLNVHDDNLVVDAKGIYSVEKFIIARRLMYWQVYLHKTVLAAEFMLENVLRRAKELQQSGVSLFATPALSMFLEHDFTKADFDRRPELLETFTQLDDYDIWSAIKVWQTHEDVVLSYLSKSLNNRKLMRIELYDKTPPKETHVQDIKARVKSFFNVNDHDLEYLVITDHITNNAYNPKMHSINLLYKDGTVVDVAKAADQLNISALAHPVTKYFICYPKSVTKVM
ncbi:MAG: HD domain-containing protein [Schleiferiaceae bacterium]|nr:HD domain-containing protein [Schleiferiaceae bacterium]